MGDSQWDGSEDVPASRVAPASDGHERRSSERIEVTWSVDCDADATFLYASIADISALGIFVRTLYPLAVGTRLTLRFAPPKQPEAFHLRGVVQWVNQVRPLADNPNPGMGVAFSDLTAEDRERIVEVIHTIAYVREVPAN